MTARIIDGMLGIAERFGALAPDRQVAMLHLALWLHALAWCAGLVAFARSFELLDGGVSVLLVALFTLARPSLKHLFARPQDVLREVGTVLRTG